jgi:hypothetical protein
VIYVVEGEKDADRLFSERLIATTNPFGAGKWEDSFSDYLKGARVALIPDNDSEGMKHIEKVAESLKGKVKSTKLLKLEGIPDKGDVSDWLNKGGTAEALEEWVEEETEYSSLDISFPSNVSNKNTILNIPDDAKNRLDSGQLRDNIGTSSPSNWGEYARKFDEVMRGAGSRLDKRDVAETIGLRATDNTFRKLLQRRKEEGKVRAYRGSPFQIEWINREYNVTQLDGNEEQTFLDIKFPLKIHELAHIPPGSVIGVAGFTSAGKSAFLLEIAELNALSQSMPVFYWYNEMSEARLKNRCIDFPLLYEAQKQGKFIPVKQGGFEFPDVIDPDAINLIDYLDRDDEIWLIGQDIKQLQARLNTGIVIYALQKQAGKSFGYGGLPSAKLSNLYITLDKKEENETYMVGEAEIIKCKDWRTVNPVHMHCTYHTGGKHGRLYIDGEWRRR